MLKNATYDKIKILKELSCITWFLQKHAIPNAKKAKEVKAVKMYQEMEKDITAYITLLQKLTCK